MERRKKLLKSKISNLEMAAMPFKKALIERKKKRKTYVDFSNPTNKVLSFVDQGAKFRDWNQLK